jgi:hypothetical protein
VRGGDAFYTHRFSGRHYVGVTYRYQDLRTTQNSGTTSIGSETESNSIYLFYTFYLKPTISFSFNGGPERANTNGVVQWSPALGGSFGWRGPRTSIAASAGYKISAGNGLSGAAHSSSINASVRRQLTTLLTAAIAAGYSDNKTLGPPTSFDTNGHTLSGRASLQIALAQHLGLEIGYTRVRQDYSNIQTPPNRDQAWASLSYQFRRPIGR